MFNKEDLKTVISLCDNTSYIFMKIYLSIQIIMKDKINKHTLTGTLKRNSIVPFDKNDQDSQKVLLHLRSIRDEAYRSKDITDEIVTGSWYSKLVVHPDATIRIAWDITVMIFIVYQSLEVPFRLCFDVPLIGGWVIFDFVTTAIFILDIIICFSTAYYHSGTLVVTRGKIAKNYLFGWFWVDMISTFPFSWFLTGVFSNENQQLTMYNSTSFVKAVRIFRFLKILRLLRLTKLKRILIKIEDYIASSTLATVFVFIRLLSLVFFIAHWTACWWFFIGNQDMNSYPVTWVVYAKIAESSTFDQYVTSLYWAFTTMTTVGYGDITPFTVNEKAFAMVTMILACGIFAYTVGSIGSLVSKQNSGENAYREQVVAVNRYMRKKNLPYELQFRVRRYLEYVWENRKKNNMDEKQILNLLSEPLRDEIYDHIHGKIIDWCSIFVIYEPHFIQQLTKTLESETYAPGDIVIEEGEMSTKMYFIQNGKIDIFHHSTKSTIAELGAKKYFGEIAFFLETPRCASARCIDFVDLLSLSRVNVNILLEKFPEAKIATETLIQNCIDDDYSLLYVKCYVCDGNHVAIKCNKILLNLDHDDAKKKWLDSRKNLYSHTIDPDSAESGNYHRAPKNLLKMKQSPRNIIGLPKTAAKLFPKDNELSPSVQNYLDKIDGVNVAQEKPLGDSINLEVGDITAIEDDQKLIQKYSIIYRNSESSSSDSNSNEEVEEEEDDEQVRLSTRHFRNSLLVPGNNPPRVQTSPIVKPTKKNLEKKVDPAMIYKPVSNLEMPTPYNSLEDEGYEAEIEWLY